MNRATATAPRRIVRETWFDDEASSMPARSTIASRNAGSMAMTDIRPRTHRANTDPASSRRKARLWWLDVPPSETWVATTTRSRTAAV